MFTSCELDKPSWSFHVGEADVTLDDYARMRDVVFRAHDMPLFFTPRLVWPTKSDRSQGFLIPRILFSPTYGDRLELGYFVPFGDSADTTFYGDINDKGYNGGGINVRYRPSPNVKHGDLSAYVVHDQETGRNEWRYNYQHSQDNLPGGFRGVVDIEDISNVEFFRRFAHDPRLHTLSQIYSSAYLTKNRSTYSFNILTDRRDILLTQRRSERSVRRAAAPALRAASVAAVPPLSEPHRRDAVLLLDGVVGVASGHERLAERPDRELLPRRIFPTLSMQLHTPAWLSIRPQVSVRETYYSDSLDDNSVANPFGQLTAVNNPIERFYAQAQVEVVGPSLSKIYNKSIGGFTKFKHVIEPRFRYLYTTNVNDQNRIIRFDTVDSPFLPIVRDSVEYSLTQRLIGREAAAGGSSREVASFSLTQSVSLGRPFTSATAGGLPGSTVPQQGEFTPLIAGLHVNPYQSITLDAAATFGNVSHQLDQTSLSANLIGTGTRADKYLSFTWFSSYRPPPVNGVAIDESRLQPDPPQHRLVALQQPPPRRRADQLRREDKASSSSSATCSAAPPPATASRSSTAATSSTRPNEHTEPSIGFSVSLKNIGDRIGTASENRGSRVSLRCLQAREQDTVSVSAAQLLSYSSSTGS